MNKIRLLSSEVWHLVLWWIRTDVQTNMLLSLAGVSETLLHNYQTARCHTSYGSFLDSHCRESFKSKTYQNILSIESGQVYSMWRNNGGSESAFQLSDLSLLVAAKKRILIQYYEQKTQPVLTRKFRSPSKQIIFFFFCRSS